MLTEFWWWITDLGNSKIVALIIFFTTFVGIVLYVYTGRARSERLESYRYLPFADEPNGPSDPQEPAASKKSEK